MIDLAPSSRPFAVVTGASSGIGLELARQFAEHDLDVLMIAEDDGIGPAAASLGGQPLQADLRRFDGVEQAWAPIAGSGRPVDALAINAGVGNAARSSRHPSTPTSTSSPST